MTQEWVVIRIYLNGDLMRIEDLNKCEQERIYNIIGSLELPNMHEKTDLYDFLCAVYSRTINMKKEARIACDRLSKVF